jgi:hypothetical protein
VSDWELVAGPFATRHLAKLAQVGRVGAEVEADAAERATRDALAFVDRLAERPKPGHAQERFDWRVLDRQEEIPWKVLSALNNCQKPFHLWNCERSVLDHPYQLDRRAPFTVGGAAAEGPEGMPAELETATEAFVQHLKDERLERASHARVRARDKELWSKPLPYGKPDEHKETVTIDMFGGGVPAGFDLGAAGLAPPPSPPPSSPPEGFPGTGGFSLGGPPAEPPAPPESGGFDLGGGFSFGPGGFSLGAPPPEQPPSADGDDAELGE